MKSIISILLELENININERYELFASNLKKAKRIYIHYTSRTFLFPSPPSLAQFNTCFRVDI